VSRLRSDIIAPACLSRRVRRKAMRFVQSMLVLAFCGLMAGCVQHSTPRRQESASVVLDNHGGFAHPGRRVVLHADGTFTQTRYTDVIGVDEKVNRGAYTFSPDKTQLTLLPSQGEEERLCRVDYRGQQYWVKAEDRQHIRDASLRRVSLRVDVR
jgi:hypothetical protein